MTIALAGIVCPRVNAAPSKQEGSSESPASAAPEPFALQAKLFTELRLLSRELDVVLYGATPGRSSGGGGEGLLLGTVLHPKVICGDWRCEVVC